MRTDSRWLGSSHGGERKHAVMRKMKRAEKNRERTTEPSSARTTDFEALWDRVQPIDFEGEDTSLTQDHLAVLK